MNLLFVADKHQIRLTNQSVNDIRLYDIMYPEIYIIGDTQFQEIKKDYLGEPIDLDNIVPETNGNWFSRAFEDYCGSVEWWKLTGLLLPIWIALVVFWFCKILKCTRWAPVYEYDRFIIPTSGWWSLGSFFFLVRFTIVTSHGLEQKLDKGHCSRNFYDILWCPHDSQNF